MLKKLFTSIVLVIMCISAIFALTGCATSTPDRFFDAFAEANKYTIVQIVEETTTLKIQRNKRDYKLYIPIFYENYYAFGTTDGEYDVYIPTGSTYKVTQEKEVPFMKIIDTNKASIIKEIIPNYEKGAIAKDALKNKFKKKDGKWFLLNDDGTINESYGYITIKNSTLIIHKSDVNRFELKLSSSRIGKPQIKG